MTQITATAPGKIILFGEHAVVYGRPALAVPVHDIQARATVTAGAPGSGLQIEALDLGQHITLKEAAQYGLGLMASLVLDKLGVPEPDVSIAVQSEIPLAGGLGSGAAVSAALGRALSAYLLGQPFSAEELSDLVFEVEKFYHGTPSGIDNTVICYGKPVYFVRGQAPEIFHAETPFHLLIGDTGIASPTRETVGAVKKAWEAEPAYYEAIFDTIGGITQQARYAIENGFTEHLGTLMTRNQARLRQLEVSSPELEYLIETALEAGAAGAKLSGGGAGGNMIAFVEADQVETISAALRAAGARRVLHSVVR